MELLGKDSVLIIGAGVSGLLLSQYLQKSGIPFQIFERDTSLTTRGVGWGLTLHWSLSALRYLLPEELVQRLPEAYVDREAVARGEPTTFPFYDLSTGELKAATPPAPESQRIRVMRDRFRQLLATGIDIQWGKAVTDCESNDYCAKVLFDDGSSYTGRLLVACDGGNSRIRRSLFPELPNYAIPIRVMGAKVQYSSKEMEQIRKLDPFFLQGTASANDSYMYFSVLDAPGNNNTPGSQDQDQYIGQLVVSWPIRNGFFNSESGIPFPSTTAGGTELIRMFAQTWAEPFRSLASSIPEDAEIKFLELYDWAPPVGLRGTGNVVLMGDAFHPMSMYRGEGANHAIVDVLDFVELVLPHLSTSGGHLRLALDKYEDTVIARARPAVLASRQACLDAHEWGSISGDSPLLSRRVMKLESHESNLNQE